jgi:hypothetical protein
MPHYVLTQDDVAFMTACGIDPEVTRIEKAIDRRAPKPDAATSGDCLLEKMRQMSVPLTRENYLKFAYFGNPPEMLSAEEEANLPGMFQLDAGENFE